MDDWIEQDSPVFLIDKFVDSFLQQDHIEFEGKTVEYCKGKKKTGERPYGAGHLLKLYIYGYYNRVSSSYRLVTESRRNLEAIYLLRGLKPSRRTISDFRMLNGDLIKAAFLYLNEHLLKKGIILGRSISIDGTKIKANANKTIDKHLEKWQEQLQYKMQEYLEHVSAEDKDTDTVKEEMGAAIKERDKKVAELEEELKLLSKALDDLKKGKSLPKEVVDKCGKLDLDCRRMIHKDGSIQPSFNAQVAVDNDSHCIISNKITTEANDINQLLDVVDKVSKTTDHLPEEVLADSGYSNFDQMQELEKRGLEENGKKTDLYIPILKMASETNDELNELSFVFNKEENSCICPNGVALDYRGIRESRGHRYSVFEGKLRICSNCPLYGKCTKSKTKGRSVWIGENKEYKKRKIEEMSAPDAQKKIKSRKGKIENVFGTLKTWMGKIPLLLRGKTKISIELDLYCMAYNLRRVVSIYAEKNISLSF